MKHLISCREAVRRLWRYLDGELDDGEHQRVEEHLEHCVRCCGELQFVGELERLLASQRVVTLPDDVQDRLEGFLESLPAPDEPTTQEDR